MSGDICTANTNIHPSPRHNNTLLDKAETWMAAGKKVALATVVQTWGSAPRVVGSQLIINEEAAFEGSVSGGCIESAVVTEALDILETGDAQILTFGVSDSMAWEVGLACGGEIKVYIEKLSLEDQVFKTLLDAQQNNKTIVTITNIKTSETHIWQPESNVSDLPKNITNSLQHIEKSFRLDKGLMIESDDNDLFFINPHNPPMQLFITGAVHISQCLAPMAQSLGYEVFIIDHRTAWATTDRFPNVIIEQKWADEALADHALGHRSAIVTLTHDPKLDDPALITALKSDAFYIGALGSKKTHTARLDRLKEEGFDDQALSRINAPIGLDIGAASPAEIAVAILAEITLALRGSKGFKS